MLKNVAESNKISFSKLMMSMRTALSGLTVGSTILFIYQI
jgi:Anticodon binding domain